MLRGRVESADHWLDASRQTDGTQRPSVASAPHAESTKRTKRRTAGSDTGQASRKAGLSRVERQLAALLVKRAELETTLRALRALQAQREDKQLRLWGER